MSPTCPYDGGHTNCRGIAGGVPPPVIYGGIGFKRYIAMKNKGMSPTCPYER